MKISLNWIKEYTSVDLTKEELLSRINSQLGAVDQMTDVGEQYVGIYIAKVISCVQHPNADKLKVCLIDDGGKLPDIDRNDDGHIQVVCGAPNVEADMLVAWIPPGATVPSTFTNVEPLGLDAREIRGEVSNGMLASPKELSVSDDHAGILEIDVEASPGDDFATVYKLDDLVIDLENKMFTHRPDCFGILGVARELAGIQGIEFTSPEWYKVDTPVPEGSSLKIHLDNQLPELVPRITLIALDGIKIGPSPIQMQSYLSRVGLKPINNVVDITNYIAHLTAQPMHAFDFDKVAAKSSNDGVSIVVRHPKQDEKLILLDGKTISPHEKSILICTDNEPIALAGVMGGANTEVDEHTTRILVEVANFDMYSIRRSSMMHGLFTEASMRFNKGQSPSQIQPVVAHALKLFRLNSGGVPASEYLDSDDSWIAFQRPNLTLDSEFIRSRIGNIDSLDDNVISKLLSNVEFNVNTDEKLNIQAPFWRQDIEIKEDIVEEVGRLYGLDKIPQTLPRRSVKPGVFEGVLSLKQQIRERLASSGANELLTYSFVSKKLMQITGQDMAQAFEVRNALSPELNYYRMTIVPSLLDKVHINHRSQHSTFALFELNRVHNKTQKDPSDGLPLEIDLLSFVFSSENKESKNFGGAPYFETKRYLINLLESYAIDATFKPIDRENTDSSQWLQNLSKMFISHRAASVHIGSETLGIVGEILPSIRANLKIPAFSAGFEIDLDVLSHHASIPSYQSQSKYPASSLDVTYQSQIDEPHAQLQAVLRDALDDHDVVMELTPTDIFIPEDEQVKRSTWHLKLTNNKKTMDANDTQNILKILDNKMIEHFSAKRI